MSYARLAVPTLLALGVVAAFFREVIFAQVFGTGPQIEQFRLAYSVPSLLAQAWGAALLAAAVPDLLPEHCHDQEIRARVDADVSSLCVWVGLIATSIGVLSAPALAQLLAPGLSVSENQSLVQNLRWAWLFFLLSVLACMRRPDLNSRRTFWPSASVNLLISLALVAGALFWVDPAAPDPQRLLVSASIGAIGLLVLHQLRASRLTRGWWRPALSATGKAILYAAMGFMLFRFGYEIPRLIDRSVASNLRPGVIASLDYSWGLINVPAILTVTSITTIFYPGFSAIVRRENPRAALRQYGVGLVVVVAIAAVIGLLLAWSAEPVVALVFARGAFDAESLRVTASLFFWNSLALPAMVLALILCHALFAQRAMRALLTLVVVRLISRVVAVAILVPSFAEDGLAVAYLITDVVTALVALRLVLRSFKGERESNAHA